MFRSFDLLVSNVRYVYFKLFEWLKWSVGIMPKGGVGSRRLYLAAHYILIAVTAVVLALATPWIDKLPFIASRETDYLERDLGPWLGWFVKRTWWGILFLIAYAVVKLTVYLLDLLGVRDDSQYPEIEADWDRALDALDRERIDLLETPVFLVNGLTSAEQKAMLAGGDAAWLVEEPPLTDPKAHVRVLADHRAVFVCCTRVGATGAQRANRARGGKAPALGGADDGRTMRPTSAFATQQSAFLDGDSSFGFGGGKIYSPPAATAAAATDAAAFAEAPAGTSPAFGTAALPGGAEPDLAEDTVRGDVGFEEEPPMPGGGLTRTLNSLFASMPGGADRLATKLASRPAAAAGGPLTPLSEEELNAEAGKLEFLCELVMGERGDEVPVDGLLQGVPADWTAGPGGRRSGGAEDHAARLAESVGRDVRTVHETFELRMPVVAAMTGMERLPGFKEFLGRCEEMTPQLRQSRAGQSFGAGAEVTPEAADWLADGVHEWFRGWTYKAFCQEPGREDNRKLFLMLLEVGRRRAAAAALLRRAFEEPDDPAVRLYGCYAAGTGPSEREHGFTRGLLDKLVSARHEVAWDPARVRSASRERLYTTLCFLLAAGFLAASAYLLYDLFSDPAAGGNPAAGG